MGIERRSLLHLSGLVTLAVSVPGLSGCNTLPVHVAGDRREFASAQELFDAADLVVRGTIGSEVQRGHSKSSDRGKVRTELAWPTRIVTVSVHEIYKGSVDESLRVAQTSGKGALPGSW